MKILENISLRPLNTFGMNVSARWFVAIQTLDELRELYSDKKISDNNFILGGGSNILFTKNVDGLVIRNELKGIEVVKEDADFIYVKSGAGEMWHQFVLDCIQNNRGGVENLSLIPGSVGAGPMQNIGAYGVELKDVFYELEAFHMHENYISKFSAEDCKFGYRESVFKHELKNQFFITSVTFRLSKNPTFNTTYGAIETEMKAMGVKDISIATISQAVINIRSSKLPDPKVIGNAGSFFKNPVVSAEKHAQLKKDFPEIVSYASGIDFKLAAGWMIEKCDWKGKRFGDAGVHKNQALVLVNYENANGQEIFDLSTKVLESVMEKFGVLLEREVNIY
ncbi:MAG: UDP-N-acetylmuramate dehydrogenase [Bacteroidetes bacterium]|nr:UDP-N-acetylmuramate dehydrogenase [Bacteroidota bacterium]